jgi:hypothetical protein
MLLNWSALDITNYVRRTANINPHNDLDDWWSSTVSEGIAVD